MSTPSRRARSTPACSTRCIAAGPDKVGADFYQRSLKQSADGGVPLDLGADLVRVPRQRGERRHHRQALSAKWDPWKRLHDYKAELLASDIYALRRITPEDRGKVGRSIQIGIASESSTERPPMRGFRLPHEPRASSPSSAAA